MGRAHKRCTLSSSSDILNHAATDRATITPRARRPRVSPIVIAFGLVLLALIAPPSLYLIDVSLHETNPDGGLGAFTMRFYGSLASERTFAVALGDTVIYATGSAAVAIGLGTLQALIIERTNSFGRRIASFAAICSLGTPHVLYVMGWLLVLGRGGPVNALIAFLSPEGGFNVYSLSGMTLIEGVGFTPITFLMMTAVFRATDASFEEAAMTSGASLLRTFRRITLPLGVPGLCAVMLLIFIRAFESFETPALVGLTGNVNVLTTMIYQASHAGGTPRYGEAGAYSVCLVALVLLLLAWQSRLSRQAHKYQSVTGKGFRPRVIDLGRWRYGSSAVLLLLFLMITVVPLAMLVFTSLQPFYEGFTFDAFERLSFENYASLFDQGGYGDVVINTLILGVATATLVTPFTAVCGWLVARRRPGAFVLDQLASVPLAFPAIILSVAFLDVFVNAPLPLYGTLSSLVIASCARYLPYGMRYATTGAIQLHPELEQAAAASGAKNGAVFLRVVAPLMANSMISSWLLIFLLSVQSVSLPLLLVGPGSEVMAVNLFELWQNGEAPALAAMGVLWTALMIAVSGLFYILTRGRQLGA